jgi:pimeloyl-ACP methyl ester carboxylesterase
VPYFTLSSDTTIVSPLCFAYRYSNRLPAALLYLTLLQPIIHLPTLHSALSSAPPTDYAVSSTLLCLAMLQPTFHSALRDGIPTDYPPLYSACRYSNRLPLSGVTPTDSSVVGDLNVPFLVVHGAEDDTVPVAAGKSLATALSSVSLSSSSEHSSSSAKVEFVTVERARHLVMMEQPEEVARAVWKFLRPLLR